MKWHLGVANFCEGHLYLFVGILSKNFLEQGIFMDTMMIGHASFWCCCCFLFFYFFILYIYIYFSCGVLLLIVESQEPGYSLATEAKVDSAIPRH